MNENVSETKLICCLGNVGGKYTHTRHNVGFLIGDYLIKKWGFEKVGSKFKSTLYKGTRKGVTVFIQKPTTFMNLSGEALQLIGAFYKIPLQNRVVIYDDIDLPFSHIRFREKGSGGTHNGMKSIIDILGRNDFPRLRYGIGPKPENRPLSNFVLSDFSQDELDCLDKQFDEIASVIDHVLQNETQEALRRISHVPKMESDL